jgi:hypothetical protein
MMESKQTTFKRPQLPRALKKTFPIYISLTCYCVLELIPEYQVWFTLLVTVERKNVVTLPPAFDCIPPKMNCDT